MSDHSLILWICSAIFTVIGLSGLLLPIVPGAPLLFLGLLFGAWADDFHFIGVWTLLILAGMAALTYVVEFAALYEELAIQQSLCNLFSSRFLLAGLHIGALELIVKLEYSNFITINAYD